jgi:hypothetical protein
MFLGTDQRSVRSVIGERRVKLRIRQPFPTIVEGSDSDGQAFHFSTELENISSTGLYLRMPRQVNVGDDLKFLISLSNGFKPGATASGVGRVLRVEAGLDGLNGFALAILQYEFI